MASRRDRELRFERKMTDAEALMWNIEKDPWLNPSGAMVTIVDEPIDVDALRRRMVDAVANVPRLRERVVAGLGRLSPPTWATDPEFDFGYHFRHLSLPAPGTRGQLYELVTRLYEDPYDRTRPLWMFVIIDGLAGGRSALFAKLHHTVSDGIGAIRLAERYMDLEPDAPLPDMVDLDAVIAEALAGEAAAGGIHAGADSDLQAAVQSAVGTAVDSFGHVLRRQAGIAQRAIGEAATWTADPARVPDLVEETIGGVSSAIRQLQPDDEGVEGGSPLWGNRSRHRHLESLSLSLDDTKAVGKALGASVNDVFVAGMVGGALAYHAKRDTTVEALNITFVVSTRSDHAVGGNSFVPSPFQVSGRDREPEERLREIAARMASKREAVSPGSTLSVLSGVFNLLPTSVVTQVARSQAARLDFATSNLRAAPFTVYIGGARATETICLGPVAGTAFNATMISYDGILSIGMLIDPAAVDDPADLAACVAGAFTDLAAAGGLVIEVDVGGGFGDG